MGIERARVLEVDSRGVLGAGYLVGDRLVLTSVAGPADVRRAGTATWIPASPVWSSPAGAAVLEVDDPAALMMPADQVRWGGIGGGRPVPVTAMGFAPAAARPQWPRDPAWFVGHVVPGESASLAVRGSPPAGDGMTGAALFAGAELVGVLLAGGRALPVTVLAGDAGFIALLGEGDAGLALVPVSAPATAFPILSPRRR